MTFPIIEIFCPQCKERMTLINNPRIENSFVEGYGQIVNYHYRCDSMERDIGQWHDDEGKIVFLTEKESKKTTFSKYSEEDCCEISQDKNIVVMRVLIPDLELESPYSPTTATVNMINIEKQMRDDGIKFHKSEPITNLLLNIPERNEKFIKEMETTATTYNENWSNKKGLFEDLNGKLYEPISENGLFLCPICKKRVVPLNLHKNDPDSYYYRCAACKMDFKIINKASKDFIFPK